MWEVDLRQVTWLVSALPIEVTCGVDRVPQWPITFPGYVSTLSEMLRQEITAIETKLRPEHF
jgi:hypothetical protein